MGAHTMQREQGSSHMGMAFIMGAAIGAISGLLFAPKSGNEMREDLKRRTDDMNTMAHERIDQVKDKAHSMSDKMKRKSDESMDRADDLEEQGKKAMERLDSRAASRDTKL